MVQYSEQFGALLHNMLKHAAIMLPSLQDWHHSFDQENLTAASRGSYCIAGQSPIAASHKISYLIISFLALSKMLSDVS